jgi:predicted O-methyltransferase YrrM
VIRAAGPSSVAMSLIHKLFVGDGVRKTRFHDEKGNLVDLAGWIYLPHAYLTAALKQFGYTPKVPWISYRARRLLDRIIQKDWRMVEFGSGGSTLWFAQRAGFVHSIESDPQWYATIARRIDGLPHVRYELRTLKEYSDLSYYKDRSLDFVLVDGAERAACATSAASKVKSGGLIYLDNSDKDMTIPGGDVRIAEQALINAVSERGGSIRYFVDFVPTNGAPCQGMLVELI